MYGQGDMCGGDMHGGGHAWWGACMAEAVVAGGHTWQGGMCGQGGMHSTHAPPPTLRDTVSECAGGTHPTGMHSCLF